MARRVYHGICAAQASQDGTYRINVQDIDIAAGFNFNEGDVLVVFFAVKNTVAQPHLAIYNGDTNYEVSTTNDMGVFIKQYDVEADCTDAWDDGETVAFVYTQQGTGATYYWEMINGVHASTEVYGDTKLFDDENFDSWIVENYNEADSKIALTPNTLKKLYQLLKPVEESLTWEPQSSLPIQTSLGQLTVNGMSVNITCSLPDIPTHTGQLTNNGNGGSGNNGEIDDEGEPFITKYPEENIYFTTNNGLGYTYVSDEQLIDIPRIILNDESNKIAIGDEQDEELVGITLGKPTEVKGNLLVSGNIIAGEPPSVEQTSSEIMAPNFRENGVLLTEKYNPKLEVFKFSQICANIPTNSCGTPIHRTVDVSKSGYTPIGVVGYNVNMTGSSADGLDGYFANIWECYLKNPTTVEFSIYNLRNKTITVQMEIYVLYHKDIEGGEQ